MISDCCQIESGVGTEKPLRSVPTTSNHRIIPLETQRVDTVVEQGVADLAWRTVTRGFIHPCSQWREFARGLDRRIAFLGCEKCFPIDKDD